MIATSDTPEVQTHWRTFDRNGANVFLRTVPHPPDPELGNMVRVSLTVAARRNDDWRVDTTFVTSSNQALVMQEIRRRIVGVVSALDDGRRIDPNGVYAPLIAELSAL